MRESYLLSIAGLKRDLPLIQMNETLTIASFVILGDTELVCACAQLLVKKLPEIDLLVVAEAKGIPLAFELSRLLQQAHFVVARKSVKPYMGSVIEYELRSITTPTTQVLVLDEIDIQKIKGKRVALIDDVISSGASLEALEKLVLKAGGHVVTKAAICAEGDASKRDDIIFLEVLPIFKS